MNLKAYEIQKLVTSWTKFDPVKIISIVIEEDIKEYTSGRKTINGAVLRSFLGIDNLKGGIPSIWSSIKQDPLKGKLFACLASFMTHYQLIEDFADQYITENMGGVFEVDSQSKTHTNIRRALINSGASEPEFMNSIKVPFSFEPLYKSKEYGRFFKELVKLRIQQIGWDESELEEKLVDLSIDYKFPEFLGLSKEQYEKWLNGSKITKDSTIKFSKTHFVLDGLIRKERVTTNLINRKENELDIQLILKSELVTFKKKGFEIIGESSLKYQVSRLKTHDELFEDRVWGLLARMGFDYYNADRFFRIKFTDPDVTGKQIDVFAADNETAIVVECKSSIKKTTTSFQKDIDQIAHNRERINRVIRKFFHSKQKIGWVFWTNNVIVNNNDKVRLNKNNIISFSNDDFDYFNKLTSLLGAASKYQFVGKVFENQEIPELANKIPAVQGRMGGFTYYSFSIEPEKLLKIGCVLHRKDSSADAFETYQRMVQKPRINSIKKYIDDLGGYFPNNIIININSGNKKLNFELADNSPEDSLSKIGILHLPKKYQSAIIIDGQHRLYGFAKSIWRSRNTIPVVCFENLPGKDQTRLFVDINHEQKSVKKNLLLSIMSDFNWGSSNDDEVLEALPVKLIKLLNDKLESPLKNRIQLSEEITTDLRCLTLEYLVSYGLKSQTNFFGITKNKKLIKTGYLTGPSHTETLKRAYKFFNLSLSYFETKLSGQWDIGKGEGGFIAMNIGITSLFKIINDILSYLEDEKKLMLQKIEVSDLFDNCKPFFEIIANFLQNCEPSKFKEFRGKLGARGTYHVVREYQREIKQEIPEFNPEGLDEWIEASTGQFNAPAKEIGDRLQIKIREYIFEVLKKNYGEANKNWWVEGVPINIQKACGIRQIEEKRAEPEENYIDTIDYWDILSKKENKQLFIKMFTPPGQEQKSNADKSWFLKFNNIRKKYSHPEREGVKEAELEFLEESEVWILERLKSN